MKEADGVPAVTGGTLGFYCAHKYAHTRTGMQNLMPFALKGIDVVLFSVFRSLGFNVTVRPILDSDALRYCEETLCYIDFEEYKREHKRADEDEFTRKWYERRGDITRVGDGFHGLKLSNDGTDESLDEMEKVRQIP
jgi:hypothetical protein